MSARDVTAWSVLELRERMDESMWDDRWCARSVCEEAIDALEASRAEVAALRRQVEERDVVVPELTDEECDRLCAWTHPSSQGTYYADIDHKGIRRAFADGWRRGSNTFRDLLKEIFRHYEADRLPAGNAPGHQHIVPGIWDDDNGKLSGQPCEWCATWTRVTDALRTSAQAQTEKEN